MVLADTSVWIEHLRQGHASLTDCLNKGIVLMHPFICGELACGNLKERSVILSYLNSLPLATVAAHDEAFQFIDGHKLWGRGLGWIDMHLLASAYLSGCSFWTLDKRLAQTASDLGLPN